MHENTLLTRIMVILGLKRKIKKRVEYHMKQAKNKSKNCIIM